MAFAKEVTIPGDGSYRLGATIKKYTLLDVGFITNNAGAFVLHRALEPDKLLEQAIQLKVTINPDLTGFKMSTVAAGDRARVDIFKNPNAAQLVELYHFFIDELVQRGIIERVKA
ncbi:DUF1831 domain-containing protein [Convivina intestini]|uniref:DUF1831 domain-containing protein n=1 Tax=Convivina intestini TaxID=1505726 RepID=UPI00200EBC58|nr:DUF1831 domain-containing protein [Convivina intestini]CAH1854917.1 hypothetical protein R078131_01105 [Convivina intestini]